MEKAEWTVPDILQLSGNYWASCALHASVKLDVFSHLHGETLSKEDAASACKCEARALGMLLDALASMGLIEKTPEGYTDTPFSSEYLVKSSPGYLGHIIMHHHHLMGSWSMLHESVKCGEPVRERISHGNDEMERESFLMGMFNLASQLAPRIASLIDLENCRKLLDFGGGPGTYAVHFCMQNPYLKAVVFDLPSTRSFAENIINRYGLDDRISFLSGDYFTDKVPTGFDAAWLSHILHAEGPDGCHTILLKAAGALDSGGTLLVQEFILNNAKDGPQFPALFSLNMLLGTAKGQSYSEAELREMMERAGLSDIKRLPLSLPNGSGIMAGTAP